MFKSKLHRNRVENDLTAGTGAAVGMAVGELPLVVTINKKVHVGDYLCPAMWY